MKSQRNRFPEGVRGFTIMELMIVVAIVAILATLAVPSYQDAIRKSNRSEAQQLLMNWASLQEIWRANHTTYAEDTAAPDGIPLPTHDKYTFSLGTPDPPTATQYTLIATATGNQANDKSQSVSCKDLSLDQANTKTPAVCW